MPTIFTPKPVPLLLDALTFAPVHAWTFCHADVRPLVTQSHRADYVGGVALLHGAQPQSLKLEDGQQASTTGQCGRRPSGAGRAVA
ncbi:MAG: hypothetical protein JJT81_16695 [Rubellimicrobium sp.]|nr:hypothetical protein [Rubellimicrobium sp.]